MELAHKNSHRIEQRTHLNDQEQINRLYHKLYQKITQMTKAQIIKRQTNIYSGGLSFVDYDRKLIYMELGIITQILETNNKIETKPPDLIISPHNKRWF